MAAAAGQEKSPATFASLVKLFDRVLAAPSVDKWRFLDLLTAQAGPIDASDTLHAKVADSDAFGAVCNLDGRERVGFNVPTQQPAPTNEAHQGHQVGSTPAEASLDDGGAVDFPCSDHRPLSMNVSPTIPRSYPFSQDPPPSLGICVPVLPSFAPLQRSSERTSGECRPASPEQVLSHASTPSNVTDDEEKGAYSHPDCTKTIAPTPSISVRPDVLIPEPSSRPVDSDKLTRSPGLMGEDCLSSVGVRTRENALTRPSPGRKVNGSGSRSHEDAQSKDERPIIDATTPSPCSLPPIREDEPESSAPELDDASHNRGHPAPMGGLLPAERAAFSSLAKHTTVEALRHLVSRAVRADRSGEAFRKLRTIYGPSVCDKGKGRARPRSAQTFILPPEIGSYWLKELGSLIASLTGVEAFPADEVTLLDVGDLFLVYGESDKAYDTLVRLVGRGIRRLLEGSDPAPHSDLPAKVKPSSSDYDIAVFLTGKLYSFAARHPLRFCLSADEILDDISEPMQLLVAEIIFMLPANTSRCKTAAATVPVDPPAMNRPEAAELTRGTADDVAAHALRHLTGENILQLVPDHIRPQRTESAQKEDSDQGNGSMVSQLHASIPPTPAPASGNPPSGAERIADLSRLLPAPEPGSVHRPQALESLFHLPPNSGEAGLDYQYLVWKDFRPRNEGQAELRAGYRAWVQQCGATGWAIVVLDKDWRWTWDDASRGCVITEEKVKAGEVADAKSTSVEGGQKTTPGKRSPRVDYLWAPVHCFVHYKKYLNTEIMMWMREHKPPVGWFGNARYKAPAEWHPHLPPRIPTLAERLSWHIRAVDVSALGGLWKFAQFDPVFFQPYPPCPTSKPRLRSGLVEPTPQPYSYPTGPHRFSSSSATTTMAGNVLWSHRGSFAFVPAQHSLPSGSTCRSQLGRVAVQKTRKNKGKKGRRKATGGVGTQGSVGAGKKERKEAEGGGDAAACGAGKDELLDDRMLSRLRDSFASLLHELS